MFTYFVRRLIAAVPVLLGIAVVVFTISHLIPGDAAQIYLGTATTPESLHLLRIKFGLNQPLPIQFFDWLGQIVRGNFGTSLTQGMPVLTLLEQRFPVTLELTVCATVVALIVGVPLGVLAAARKHSVADQVISSISLLGLAIPDFWFGTMLVLLFSLDLGLLPSLGYAPLSQGLWPNLEDMILPSVSLAVGLAAVIIRFTRSAMLEVLGKDYVRTAQAKGLGRTAVLFKHAFRNAFIPVITVAGLQFSYLLGGVVIIEEIFALPGIGRLALTAINQRDYPTLQASVLWFAVVFVLINLVVDVLYGLIDPRTHYE